MKSRAQRAKVSRSAMPERRPRKLSGGQQQRVALGRCIVRNPKVFMFDEPLPSDAHAARQMSPEIKELRQARANHGGFSLTTRSRP